MTHYEQNGAEDTAQKDAIRETRRILRQVQLHLNEITLSHGALCETVGFTEVYAHGQNDYRELNYITPRRGTAWVSGKDIEQGLEALRVKGKTPRLTYIEGLFPPQFARNLRDLNLTLEHEQPLMVYLMNPDTPPAPAPLPAGITVSEVTDAQGSAIWWYVWRNAHYDVIAPTASPGAIGIDLYHIAQGIQIDLVLYRSGFPIGVARLDICQQHKSAQITAVALIKEVRSPQLMNALLSQVIALSQRRDCTLIFVCDDRERQMYRSQGFLDSGSILSYSEIAAEAPHDTHEETLRPLVTLR